MESIFVVLIFGFLIHFIISTVISFENNRVKVQPEILDRKIEPNAGSGWLYVVERDGYLKIGRTNFEKLDPTLTARLKAYINITEIPAKLNLNLLYFDFFENANSMEIELKNHIRRFKKPISSENLSQQYYDDINSKITDKEREFWFEEVYFSTEWFKLHGDLGLAEEPISTWFRNSYSQHKSREWIIKETIEDLRNFLKIFIHNFPEVNQVNT